MSRLHEARHKLQASPEVLGLENVWCRREEGSHIGGTGRFNVCLSKEQAPWNTSEPFLFLRSKAIAMHTPASNGESNARRPRLYRRPPSVWTRPGRSTFARDLGSLGPGLWIGSTGRSTGHPRRPAVSRCPLCWRNACRDRPWARAGRGGHRRDGGWGGPDLSGGPSSSGPRSRSRRERPVRVSQVGNELRSFELARTTIPMASTTTSPCLTTSKCWRNERSCPRLADDGLSGPRPAVAPCSGSLSPCLARAGASIAPARHQAAEPSARQVTLFGVIATPGDTKIDPKLRRIEPQLRKVLAQAWLPPDRREASGSRRVRPCLRPRRRLHRDDHPDLADRRERQGPARLRGALEPGSSARNPGHHPAQPALFLRQAAQRRNAAADRRWGEVKDGVWEGWAE